jgi:hypothetical protein
MVLVEVARQPKSAAQKPNILKLSSVTDVSSIPPTIGTKEAQMRHSKYFLHTNHCKITVVAGVKDLMVCINDTGIYLRLTFPKTIFMQKTKDMGNILLHLSSGSTSIRGFIFSTFMAM